MGNTSVAEAGFYTRSLPRLKPGIYPRTKVFAGLLLFQLLPN